VIRVEIDDRQVIDAINQLKQATSDLTPAMRAIGQDLAENIRLGFRDSTDPWGSPWQPLSPLTVLLRRNGSAKPLMDTGSLRNSINAQADATSVTVGTNDKRGPVHQYGATIKPKKGKYLSFGNANVWAMLKQSTIPARPFMPIQGNQANLPPDWQEQIVDTIGDFINQSIQ
jgi:phage virion morphogenesis protein